MDALAPNVESLLPCPCCFTSLLHVGDPHKVCNLRCGHLLCRPCWNTICEVEMTDNAPCPVCRQKTHHDDARVAYLPQLQKPGADPRIGFGINDLRFCMRYTDPFLTASQVCAVYPPALADDLKFVQIALVAGMTEESTVMHARQFVDANPRETLGGFSDDDAENIINNWHKRRSDMDRVLRNIEQLHNQWSFPFADKK
jgi:hypothetical protein